MKEAKKTLAGKIREFPQKYYRIIAAVIALFVFAIAVGAVSATTKIVEIIDHGQVETYYVTTQDKEEILKIAGFTEEDEIAAELTEFVNGKATLTIYRPFTATIMDGGKEITCTVLHTTVEETLEQAGIELGTHDKINMELDAYATTEPIVIDRINYEVVEETEAVPYEVIYQPTSTLTVGTSRTITYGQNGVKTYTYSVRFENGKEVERKLTEAEITEEPVDAVVLVGTTPVVARTGPISQLRNNVKLDKNGVPVNYKDAWGGMSAVAYYAEKGSGTASGLMRCVPGVVAVDPRVIPYGTEMYIIANDGTVYGYAIAADTGYSVQAGIIDLDLFMNTVQDCYAWGRKTVTIYFL